MKRVLSIMLVLAMLMALMVGCDSKNTGTETGAKTDASTSTDTGAKTDTSKSTDPGAIESTGTEPSEDQPLAGKLIGISASYLEDDFCIEMNYGIVDRLKALGAEVVLQNSNTDGELQTRQIENFVEMGVDYMFVNPPTLDVCVPAIEAAADAGIRMVLFDGGANTDKGIITHVSQSNTKMGEAVGEYFVDYIKNELNGKATILMESWMEYERHQERMSAVKSVLDATDLDVTYVDLDSEGSREGAANVTANYAGDYDLIICSEMNTAWGAISTLEAQNKKGVKVAAV